MPSTTDNFVRWIPLTPEDRRAGRKGQEEEERAIMTSCATSIDCELSPASPSTSASSLRRSVAARADSEERIFAPSSRGQRQRGRQVAQLVDADVPPESAERRPTASCRYSRAFASACRIRTIAQWSPIGRRRHQRLGQAASAGQVHRDQVEEDADHVPEVAAPRRSASLRSARSGRKNAERSREPARRPPGWPRAAATPIEPHQRPSTTARAGTAPSASEHLGRQVGARRCGPSGRGRCACRPSSQPRSAASSLQPVAERAPVDGPGRSCAEHRSSAVVVCVVIDRRPRVEPGQHRARRRAAAATKTRTSRYTPRPTRAPASRRSVDQRTAPPSAADRLRRRAGRL